MKRARIGGQAVIEGVMMKYEDQYAVAVRKPDQEIEVKVESYTPIGEKYKILKLPILRGVVNFFESLVIGVKTLTYSADFYEEEEPTGKSENKDDFRLSDTESNNGSGSGENGSKNNKKESSTGDDLMMIGTVIVSLAIAIALFMLLPAFIAGLLVFMFINVKSMWLRLLSRVLLVPIIAGISYEFIMFAGRSDSKLANILSVPGMWVQRLTTKEPDLEMCEVAIRSVEAVIDWRAYQDAMKRGEIED